MALALPVAVPVSGRPRETGAARETIQARALSLLFNGESEQKSGAKTGRNSTATNSAGQVKMDTSRSRSRLESKLELEQKARQYVIARTICQWQQ